MSRLCMHFNVSLIGVPTEKFLNYGFYRRRYHSQTADIKEVVLQSQNLSFIIRFFVFFAKSL